jgi:hypothetical protein
MDDKNYTPLEVKVPEKPKHAGGRPSEYDPAYIQKVDDYLLTTGKEQTSLPTIEGYAIYLDVSRQSLYEWSKKYPEFSYTLKRIELRQKQQLIDDGIYGGKEVNATIVKLLLQNNHGMKERTDTTSGDKPIPLLAHVSSNNSNQEDITTE